MCEYHSECIEYLDTCVQKFIWIIILQSFRQAPTSHGPEKQEVQVSQSVQSSTQLVCCDTDVNRFLAGQGRKIKSSQPDGNCLFRCFSYQLLGKEDEHIAVRSLLVRFENLNQETFAPYLMSVNSQLSKLPLHISILILLNYTIQLSTITII